MSKLETCTGWLASGWIYWPATLAGWLLIGAAVLGPEAERRLAIEDQVQAMQAEVDALARTRDQLVAMEQALQNDPAYIERAVRQDLGITRPGEMRLPQPVRLQAAARKEPPQPVQAEVPSVLGMLVRYNDPKSRTLLMTVGGTMLGVALLLSLPNRRATPKRA